MFVRASGLSGRVGPPIKGVSPRDFSDAVAHADGVPVAIGRNAASNAPRPTGIVAVRATMRSTSPRAFNNSTLISKASSRITFNLTRLPGKADRQNWSSSLTAQSSNFAFPDAGATRDAGASAAPAEFRRPVDSVTAAIKPYAMCGRATKLLTWREIVALYRLTTDWRPNIEPSFNLVPTNDIWVYASTGGERSVEPMRWGLIPSWAKEPPKSATFNARSDGLDKPTWRGALKDKRGVVAFSGFFEWRKDGAEKQPYYVTRRDGTPIIIAALGPQTTALRICGQSRRPSSPANRTRRWRRSTIECRPSSRPATLRLG